MLKVTPDFEREPGTFLVGFLGIRGVFSPEKEHIF